MRVRPLVRRLAFTGLAVVIAAVLVLLMTGHTSPDVLARFTSDF